MTAKDKYKSKTLDSGSGSGMTAKGKKKTGRTLDSGSGSGMTAESNRNGNDNGRTLGSGSGSGMTAKGNDEDKSRDKGRTLDFESVRHDDLFSLAVAPDLIRGPRFWLFTCNFWRNLRYNG